MSIARKIVGPRLDEAQMLRADYFQRKGFTMREIAEQLGTDRETVVQSIYWDRVTSLRDSRAPLSGERK